MSQEDEPPMNSTASAALVLAAGSLAAQAAPQPPMSGPDPQAQVWATECTFARSMAERDLAAFARHLSPQAIFFNGKQALRGPEAIVAGWRGYFDGPQAPFSWAPDQVEVLADSSLAYSTGLVRNPKGEAVARFASVWRQEAPGQWRIVLDKGAPLTEAERAAPAANPGPGC